MAQSPPSHGSDSTDGTRSPDGSAAGQGVDPLVKARAALGRYRVMAWVTGTMLLLLTTELVLKYAFHANGYETGADGAQHARPVIGTWVAFAHGWIYVVYLAMVLDLWSKMRWRFGRLVAMVLAGVVPVMSFVLERRIHSEAEVLLQPDNLSL